MPRVYNLKDSNWSVVEKIEPLQNELSIKYFYSKWNIEPKKNKDKYGVDFLFRHPKTNKLIGVEYKTVEPKNWKYKNIKVYRSSQNNDNTPNQIYKELENNKSVHWHYLHPGSNQLFIIYNQEKLKKLYYRYCDINLPTAKASFYNLFDQIIDIPENEPILIKIKEIYLDIANSNGLKIE